MLPSTATQINAYTNLKITSLVSIGQLCDSNCSALKKKDAAIFNSDKITVLNGTSNTSDVLWDVAIETSRHKPPLTANSNYHTIFVHHLNKIKPELSSYLHAAAVCPTKSTLIQAINK